MIEDQTKLCDLDPQQSTSLFQSHSSQRRHELEKKKSSEAEAARERRAQKRSRAEMEVEEREKGLGTELDASNKGFAMLQKMGYKKGELHLSLSIHFLNPWHCNESIL